MRNRRTGWYETGLEHIWLPYAQMKTTPAPLPAVRTYGSRIVLEDGSELIDGIASWWTACHGYNHPQIGMSVARQLEVMPHVMMGGLVHEQAMTLATRLSAMLPGDLDHVFFSESGSIAVEIAMKMSVQYWLNKGHKGRKRFIAFKGGYHGDTTGAMAVSDPALGFHSVFQDAVPAQFIVPLPIDDASAEKFAQFVERQAEKLAGIIVEPLVQGAGGMVFHDGETLKRIRAVADKYELLLIFDEIFTGFGRTGKMFACEEAGAVPDIITLSKALTGGTLPLAATVANEKVFEAFWSDNPEHALMHGPTYTGNALACAAANASLDLFEREPRLAEVAAIEQLMKQGLEPCRELPGVKDVRVKGAIGVVELEKIDDVNAMRQRFLKEGAFVRPFGSMVYLTPAFTIAPDELDVLCAAVVTVLGGGKIRQKRRAK